MQLSKAWSSLNEAQRALLYGIPVKRSNSWTCGLALSAHISWACTVGLEFSSDLTVWKEDKKRSH